MPDDTDTTQNVMTRYKYTGSILAGALILSIPVIVIGAAAGWLTLAAVPDTWMLLYQVVALMAVTWAFGKKTLKNAWNVVRSN